MIKKYIDRPDSVKRNKAKRDIHSGFSSNFPMSKEAQKLSEKLSSAVTSWITHKY